MKKLHSALTTSLNMIKTILLPAPRPITVTLQSVVNEYMQEVAGSENGIGLVIERGETFTRIGLSRSPVDMNSPRSDAYSCELVFVIAAETGRVIRVKNKSLLPKAIGAIYEKAKQPKSPGMVITFNQGNLLNTSAYNTCQPLIN